MRPIQLNGDIVSLREVTDDDIPTFAQNSADPDVVRYTSWGPMSVDDSTRWVRDGIAAQAASPRTWFLLTIVPRGTDDVAGHIALRLEGPNLRTAEVGYTVGKDHWTRGYATDALRLVTNFAFAELDRVERVWASCDEENVASVRVLEKVGYVKEGRLRKQMFRRERWRNSLIYALLREEWSVAPDPSR